MIDTLKKEALGLVASELGRARQAHGAAFASAHEGWGVLAEEIYEAKTELKKADSYHTSMMDGIHDGNRAQIIDCLCSLEDRAICAACECLQVAAVARKMREGM